MREAAWRGNRSSPSLAHSASSDRRGVRLMGVPPSTGRAWWSCRSRTTGPHRLGALVGTGVEPLFVRRQQPAEPHRPDGLLLRGRAAVPARGRRVVHERDAGAGGLERVVAGAVPRERPVGTGVVRDRRLPLERREPRLLRWGRLLQAVRDLSVRHNFSGFHSDHPNRVPRAGDVVGGRSDPDGTGCCVHRRGHHPGCRYRTAGGRTRDGEGLHNRGACAPGNSCGRDGGGRPAGRQRGH